MEFYSNFLEQCALKGVAPTSAAIDIGLSNAAASGWKKGKQPSDVTLQKLSVYFGCTLEELTAEKEQKEKPALSNENELDETTRELVSLAYSLNDDDRALLLEMARSIKKRREA